MGKVDHVGFTGSRLGMTPWQRAMFKRVLLGRIALYGVGVFRHGLCVGADAQAHEDARNARYYICGHPPLKDSNVHPFGPNEFEWLDSPFSFSGRNQRIVVRSNILIATPRTGSVGTYNAIQHAENLRKPRIIIREDETVEYLGCKEGDYNV